MMGTAAGLVQTLNDGVVRINKEIDASAALIAKHAVTFGERLDITGIKLLAGGASVEKSSHQLTECDFSDPRATR